LDGSSRWLGAGFAAWSHGAQRGAKFRKFDTLNGFAEGRTHGERVRKVLINNGGRFTAALGYINARAEFQSG
jgi:phage-related minor tail protein